MKRSAESNTAASSPAPGLRVAIVHDWLLGMRGGEWLLDALLKLFPAAEIHTLFYEPRAVAPAINRRAIHPSALNKLPGVRRYYRWLLPAFPAAARGMQIAPGADLVLAVSHCAAHAVATPAAARRINYYLSPMRYLYDQSEAYQRGGGLAARGLDWVRPWLTGWDRAAARRPGVEAWTISQFVASRLRAAYALDSRVIYPPVRTAVFTPAAGKRVDEWLVVSALVPYKNVDLAIRTANRLGRPLRVVGGGPLLGAMRALAGPTVHVEGAVSQSRLLELYRTRRALIYAAEEDFGIVPLEALACGMPVLGLGRGGLCETVPAGTCGAWFDRPDEASLIQAWEHFDPRTYDPLELRRQAERFAEERFLNEVGRAIYS